MNKPRFLELVRDPDKLEFFDLEKLEEVVASFPYFQAAHVFIAKIAKEQSSMFAAEKLNLAAVCTLDRKNLKRIIQSKPRKLTVFVNREEQLPTVADATVTNVVSEITITALETTSEVESTELAEDIKVVKELPSKPTEETEETKEIAADINKKIEQEITENIEKEEVNQEFDEEKVIEEIKASTEILAEEIEATKPIEAAPVNDFYSELEKNLEQLRQAKLEAGLQKPSVENVVEDANIKAPMVLEPTDDVRETPVHPIESVATELPLSTLENSRLDDILLHTINDKNKIEGKDLLIEYFNFLEQKRKERESNKKSVTTIIDKFIAEEPTIPKLKADKRKEPLVDLAEKSVKPKGIVSENFAKILVFQGKEEKAIEMYEALILKNPEKKAYFANLILELKNKNT